MLDKQGDSGEFEHSNGDDSDDDALRISPGNARVGRGVAWHYGLRLRLQLKRTGVQILLEKKKIKY